jgi:hypothetical protein
MSPVFDAFVRSWPFVPWLSIGLSVTGGGCNTMLGDSSI